MVPADQMKNVKFVVGIDDRVYMRWQLSILLESLHGQLPPGWEVWVVVCNGHEPLSTDLQRVLNTYGAPALHRRQSPARPEHGLRRRPRRVCAAESHRGAAGRR
jgi:hypothetical protein